MYIDCCRPEVCTALVRSSSIPAVQVDCHATCSKPMLPHCGSVLTLQPLLAEQVCYYNFTKISAAQQQAQQHLAAKARGGSGRQTSAGEEGLPLVERRGGDARP